MYILSIITSMKVPSSVDAGWPKKAVGTIYNSIIIWRRKLNAMASSSEDISGASATQTALTEDGNEILKWRFADDDRKLFNVFSSFWK